MSQETIFILAIHDHLSVAAQVLASKQTLVGWSNTIFIRSHHHLSALLSHGEAFLRHFKIDIVVFKEGTFAKQEA